MIAGKLVSLQVAPKSPPAMPPPAMASTVVVGQLRKRRPRHTRAARSLNLEVLMLLR